MIMLSDLPFFTTSTLFYMHELMVVQLRSSVQLHRLLCPAGPPLLYSRALVVAVGREILQQGRQASQTSFERATDTIDGID
jgi:hypothetical protein